MKKRLLSGIICLCLLLAMFPAMASAEGKVIASGNCGGEGDGTNLTWTLTDDYTLTISGEGEMRDYYGTDARAPWYEYRESLKTLVIESGVTSIGSSSFEGCSSFTGTLVIPEGVTSIGMFAFSGCSGFTGSLVIPEGVTGIGMRAFSECSGFTGDLVIPEGVTAIALYAFSGCSGFTGDLVIPEGVTGIGDGAFSDCTGFTGDLVIPDSVTSIYTCAFSGCAFTGDLIIPASVFGIGAQAFDFCTGSSGNVYFEGNAPNMLAAAFVIAYEDKAFFNKNVTLYYIPGTTGWTDSEYYDAEAGTWLGYKLATWDNESIDSSDESISFTDVTTADWFYSYVADMTKAGVVSGYPDGSFRPQGNVTWGEALKLVLKATGYGEFEAGAHWASGYMDKALAEGFMDHEVDLNSAITRGEMADLTAKAMKLAPSTSPNPFDDEVSSYAVALYEAEIITGSQDNGRLVYRADSTITRAEMAAIISRVYNK